MSEKNTILAALRRAGDRIADAARDLGISRRTLQSRMREHNIPPGKRGRPRKKIYSKRAKRYAVAAVATGAAVAGFIALERKGR